MTHSKVYNKSHWHTFHYSTDLLPAFSVRHDNQWNNNNTTNTVDIRFHATDCHYRKRSKLSIFFLKLDIITTHYTHEYLLRFRWSPSFQYLKIRKSLKGTLKHTLYQSQEQCSSLNLSCHFPSDRHCPFMDLNLLSLSKTTRNIYCIISLLEVFCC